MSDKIKIFVRLIFLFMLMVLSVSTGHAQADVREGDEAISTVVQSGHDIKYLDVSADKKYLLTSDGRYTIALWDFEKRRVIKMLSIPHRRVFFHPLGPSWIMVKPVEDIYGNDIYTYNIFTGKRLGVRRLDEFQQNGRWMNEFIFEKKGSAIELKSRRTGQTIGQFDGGYGFTTGPVALNSTDSLLLQAGLRPLVWDLKNAKIISQIPYLDYLKNDPELHFKDDFTVPVHVTDSSRIKSGRYDYGWKNYTSGSFVNGNEVLLAGYNSDITRWGPDGKLLERIPTHGSPVYTFIDNGKYRIAATYRGLDMGKLSDGQLTECQGFNAPSHYKLLYNLSPVIGEEYFITGGDDGNLLLGRFGEPDFRKKLIHFSSPLLSFDIDRSEKTVLVSGELGLLREVPIDAPQSYFAYDTAVFKESKVDCAAYIDDDWFAAGCNDGVIGFWKRGIKEPQQTVYAHKDEIIDLKMSHNKRWLISADSNGMMRIWDAASRVPLMDIHHLGLADDYIFITPDNYYKASKNAFDQIHFVKGMKVLSFEQFDLIFNRPDIVLQRLGQSVEQTRPYYLAWQKRLRRMGYTEDMLSGEINAPEISVSDKMNIPASTQEKNLTLTLHATDQKYALSRIFVSLNGVPLYGKRGMDISGRYSTVYDGKVSLELCSGNNRIDISCMNEKGVESYREQIDVFCEADSSKPSLFIASIGVSKYAQTGFDLNFASKDAEDFVDMMNSVAKDRFADIKSMLLTDEDFSQSSVDAIKTFLGNAGRDDVVMLFYAGHGVLDQNMDYYLSTHSMDFNNPKSSGVDYYDFEAIMESTESVHRFCFVDACHSGEVDKEDYVADKIQMQPAGKLVFRNAGSGVRLNDGKGVEFVQTLFNELFVDVRWGVGATILSSAGAMEVALEGQEWENGLFTWCIKEGILNHSADLDKDGRIHTSELIDFVSNEVRQLSGGVQIPSVRQGNRHQDYIIVE